MISFFISKFLFNLSCGEVFFFFWWKILLSDLIEDCDKMKVREFESKGTEDKIENMINE